MADNIQLKDSIGNAFTLRAKDLSIPGDGSFQRTMVYATPYPVDFGAGGSFHHTSKSGVMAAGLVANAPVFAFQNPSSTLLSIVRRIRIAAWVNSVAFTAGIATFDMFVARAFTAIDTGGVTTNLAGNNTKLRSSSGSPVSVIVHSSTATLGAGTRTLDAGTVESWNIAVPSTTLTSFLGGTMKLFEKNAGEMPLVFAQNEGFIIQATVPATGTWSFSISPEWDEVPITNF